MVKCSIVFPFASAKDLGAPVGSVLVGKRDFIKQARRVRKVFGGGMRQAGYLAAAGIFALDHNIERLAVDHFHAKKIASALLKKGFTGEMMPVETNIIIFEVKERFTAQSLAQTLKDHDVMVSVISPTQIRIVLHLDVSEEMVNKTVDIIDKL